MKEVKALVESRKDRGLEIQEGLQLTEIQEGLRGLERGLAQLEIKKLEEIKELTQLEAQRIRSRLTHKERKAANMLAERSVLRELGQLDELIPEEQLRTLAEVKGTIAQLEAQKLTEVKTEVKVLKAHWREARLGKS